MYGKSVYDVWLDKYGEEEANIRLKNMKEKLSIAGKSKKKETKKYLLYFFLIISEMGTDPPSSSI